MDVAERLERMRRLAMLANGMYLCRTWVEAHAVEMQIEGEVALLERERMEEKAEKKGG